MNKMSHEKLFGSQEAVDCVDRAILTRRSVRAFLDTPVPRSTVEEILAVASRAPSGTNTQPWRVYVLSGEAKAKLCADVLAAYEDPSATASTGRSTRTIRANGPTRICRGGARWAGTCTGCSRSAARTRRACTNSMRATFVSSMRRWASSSPSTASWSRAAGSTTACSCKASWSPPARAGSIPARRRRLPNSTRSSPATCGCRQKKWWCAACRSVLPIRRPSQTASPRNGSQSAGLRVFSHSEICFSM
ncbi:protein of unknown function [Cupriavidus taiwanensis]|nr:protein of unknown function [Cupriavidus taiwanensis]